MIEERVIADNADTVGWVIGDDLHLHRPIAAHMVIT